MTPSRLTRPRVIVLVVLLVVAVAVVASAAASCSRGQATTGMKLAPPVLPEKEDLKTPDAAVKTYLETVSFAYRMANSELASRAATPYEGVRIDSYIELNRQKDQGIEQQLVSFKKRSESKEGTAVLVAATEGWKYRYFSLSKREYTSQMYEASYDTTYTVIKDPRGWLVDKVAVKDLTPVK